jgi:uncharacterized protein YggE
MSHAKLLRRPLYVVLLAVAAMSLGPGHAVSQTRDAVPWLTIIGSGEATARPDTADLQVGVVSEASTARDALSANTTAMQALYTTLAAFHIAERDRQTTTFNVSPIYGREERRGQSPRVMGYRVENRLRLTMRDLARLGELLDALVTQGANTVHSIQFRLGDAKAVLDQARRAAVDEARHKATLYAQAAGVTLGRVLSLREEEASPPAPMPVAARTMAAEAGVPVAPGEATVTVRVVVTYELVGQ